MNFCNDVSVAGWGTKVHTGVSKIQNEHFGKNYLVLVLYSNTTH